MRKKQALEELSKYGIAYHSNISVTEANFQLGEWQKLNNHPEIIQLARKKGQDVLFTQPQFSDWHLLSCSGRTSSQKQLENTTGRRFLIT